MLLDRLIVKGNEIKEPGLFGKTVYVIKGNEIKEPGFLGKTVYVIKGNEIKEPGLLGRTVYVIKGDEIRTPGWFGNTVARTKSDGTVRYNKSTEEPASHKASGIGSTGSASSRNDEPTLTTAEPFVVEESLDELQKRLDKEIGCVVDYTNCSPDRKTYSIPRKYNKLTAIAPALRLESINIHSGVAVIAVKSVRVSQAFIVEEGNPYYSSVNGVLYNKDKTVLLKVPYGYDIATFSIPDTVTHIGEWAFGGCTMGGFVLPTSIVSIGKSAFSFCKKFKSIFIPKEVKCVGEKAFEGSEGVQIMSDAIGKPNEWNIDESQFKNPIQWNVTMK